MFQKHDITLIFILSAMFITANDYFSLCFLSYLLSYVYDLYEQSIPNLLRNTCWPIFWGWPPSLAKNAICRFLFFHESNPINKLQKDCVISLAQRIKVGGYTKFFKRILLKNDNTFSLWKQNTFTLLLNKR